MPHFIWSSGGYVATLVDELIHVLSGGSETTAGFHDATTQENSRAHGVLQQLRTTRDKQGENSVHFYLFSVGGSGDLFSGLDL